MYAFWTGNERLAVIPGPVIDLKVQLQTYYYEQSAGKC